MSRPANPEMRAKVLKAAENIIETCGPDCVTMREVAEKIGYSPTTIYLYFKDKGEVLKETVKAAFIDFGDTMFEAAVGPTPLDKMRQRSHAYVVWALTHPGLYQMMFQAPYDFEWSSEDIQATSKSYMDSFDVVQAAIEVGQLTPIPDMMNFGVRTWAAMHGVVSLAIARRLGPEMPEMTLPEVIEVASAMTEDLGRLLTAPYVPQT